MSLEAIVVKDTVVGIDVGAKSVVVAAVSRDKKLQTRTYDNTPSGRNKLLKWLLEKSSGRGFTVCLEATGVYSFDLAVLLGNTEGVVVGVVNPKVSHAFGQAIRSRSKTDSEDAQVLLEYAKRMDFEPWKPPARYEMELRSTTRRMNQLKAFVTAEKNRLHAATSSEEHSDPDTQASIERTLAFLDEEIERLKAHGQAIIDQHAELKAKQKRMQTIPGIGALSSMILLSELVVLSKDMKAKHWASHAGLAPRHHESGTISKPARITKAGNKHLRQALYMPALVAIEHQPHIKAWRDKLLKNNKTKLQANVAVMRKMLHAIWGMMNHQQDFDPEKLFPDIKII